MTTIVGVDLSLKSPGVVVLSQETWTLYFFQQLKRERHLKFKSANVVMLPPIQNTKTTTDVERYAFICKHIAQIVNKYENPLVALEGYAYSCQSAHSAKLHELGGVLKYMLREHRVVVIASSMWKKRAFGKGNLDKRQVVDKVKTHGPCLDLFTLFGVDPKKKHVPNPIQDIADAIGIVLTAGLIEDEATHKRRKVE